MLTTRIRELFIRNSREERAGLGDASVIMRAELIWKAQHGPCADLDGSFATCRAGGVLRREWTYSLPSLLNDPQARDAFDRLAAAGFKNNNWSRHPKNGPGKPKRNSDDTKRAGGGRLLPPERKRPLRVPGLDDSNAIGNYSVRLVKMRHFSIYSARSPPTLQSETYPKSLQSR